MSFLEVLALIGYSLGAWMHLWMGLLLLKQTARRGNHKDENRNQVFRLERVLLALTLVVGVWHTSNLSATLYGLLGFTANDSTVPLRIFDSFLVVTITVTYSLLLHAHLLLWAQAKHRGLSTSERVRVGLSYLPILFLYFAIQTVWAGDYSQMFEKLTSVVVLGWEVSFVKIFAYWATYVLIVVATTDLLIANITNAKNERRMMRTLAASFVVVACAVLAVHGFQINQNATLESHLQVLANLGSLLPTALLAYYIYRYRYLEIIIRRSLVAATFAIAILIVYLYGVQLVGAWLTNRYALRSGVVETLLTLALAIAAAPLRGWIEHRFQQLFVGETELFRDIVNRLRAKAWQYKQLPELLRFVEERTASALNLKQVVIHVFSLAQNATMIPDVNEETIYAKRDVGDSWIENLVNNQSSEIDGIENDVIENNKQLQQHDFNLAYVLRHDKRALGAMLVSAPPENLTPEVRRTLAVLAGQVSLAIAECRLVEENVQLERRLVQGERLAALGQMTATIAHEIKNPLASIKSIAQVMSEDLELANTYQRDLQLIVGETNRLNRSVSQMLEWTRQSPPVDTPCLISELIDNIVQLFKHEIESRHVQIKLDIQIDYRLDGRSAAALRDALSNLLLNALQASASHTQITFTTNQINESSIIIIADEGAGISVNLRERIWEPFFTTKQQGTGLGLSIVRKRLAEINGSIELVSNNSPRGTAFRITLPDQIT